MSKLPVSKIPGLPKPGLSQVKLKFRTSVVIRFFLLLRFGDDSDFGDDGDFGNDGDFRNDGDFGDDGDFGNGDEDYYFGEIFFSQPVSQIATATGSQLDLLAGRNATSQVIPFIQGPII